MPYRAQHFLFAVLLAALTGCAAPPRQVDARVAAVVCKVPDPAYPAEAQRAHVEGQVIVFTVVEMNGKVSEGKLYASSGSSQLDEAAIRATSAITCTPFRDPETGGLTRASFLQSYVFRLYNPSLYADRVRQKVRQNIVYGGEISDDVSAVVKVLLGPDGMVLRATLDKSSGVPGYDEAVLRAIDRSSPFPVEKTGQLGSRTLVLTFKPK